MATKKNLTKYQARHSAKALRRLIRTFGESSTLGAAFKSVNTMLPKSEVKPAVRVKKAKPAAKKAADESKDS